MAEEKTKWIKIKCNLTGTTYNWSQDYVNSRVGYYGDMANMLKFFVQSKIVKHIVKGKKLEDLSRLFGFEIDHTKDLFYKELFAFHINKARESKTTTRVQSTTTNIVTDEDVSDFIQSFQEYLCED